MENPVVRFGNLWLVTIAFLLAACVRSVAPISQYVLVEQSVQAAVYPNRLWTLSFDHRFQAESSSDSTGTLEIDSTLTIHNPGVKQARITIIFVDAQNRALGTDTLLNIKSFPTNPVYTSQTISTPAGTLRSPFNPL